MPRKVAKGRTYDVPFVGIGITPARLSRKQTDEVARILGRDPSPEFMHAYCYKLAVYDAHHKAVTSSTPAAVQKRIGAVVDHAKALQNSLKKLTLTDKMIFGRFADRRFLREQRYAGIGELAETIVHFLPVMEDALTLVTNETKQGRPPAFAEHELASSLCQILFEELGTAPVLTKNGKFDRLLRAAFAAISKPRNDVSDLIRVSLHPAPTAIRQHPEFLLLPRFANRTPEPTQSTQHKEAGTNNRK